MTHPPPSLPPTPGASTSGRDRAIGALVDAAIELFGARGPDSVSLREVAAAAEVNYGLIHQYVGSKDDLLRLAIGSVSRQSTVRFSSDDPAISIERLIGVGPASPSLRLLAWSLLQGRRADDLIGRSSALGAFADRLSSDPTTDDDRRSVAVIMSMILGWQLFGDYLLESLGLDDDSREMTATQIRSIARSIAAESAEQGRGAS